MNKTMKNFSVCLQNPCTSTACVITYNVPSRGESHRRTQSGALKKDFVKKQYSLLLRSQKCSSAERKVIKLFVWLRGMGVPMGDVIIMEVWEEQFVGCVCLGSTRMASGQTRV
ncbi:hypothetical protein CEXT_394611 [Caerostris extrusa]|uniref:Uncharacterized protein n=1 Tax=Caerostris extrusa TaxID=172846 RepID=A0AAV4VKT7_CAEEX|nr:hypothetical protein CEXT_394611 [Caerostris extrusa]